MRVDEPPLRAALLKMVPDTVAVRRRYRKRNGRVPNLRNPRDFTDKLCWLKLHHVTPLQRVCVDKIAVRDHVADVIGPNILVPEIARLTFAHEITPDTIPAKQFVAKTAHDSGGVVICRDAEAFDWADARATLAIRQNRDYYWQARERVYRNIPRRILVETYLEPADGSPLRDTKMWCIHGKVVMIEALDVQFDGMKKGCSRQAFFDTDWQQMDVKRVHPAPDILPKRPAGLSEMIDIATRLSAPFEFARIDLFSVDSRVYFGEITFFPSGAHVRFKSDADEARFGDMLHLPAR